MRRILTIALLALIALASIGPLSAHDEDDDTQTNGGDERGGLGLGLDLDLDVDLGLDDAVILTPAFASSYINPDTEAAAANPDVRRSSDCYLPDQYDQQRLSTAGTTDRNVHYDPEQNGCHDAWVVNAIGIDWVA